MKSNCELYSFNKICYECFGDCLNNSYVIFQSYGGHINKFKENLIPITLATLLSRKSPITIRILFDSGGSATIMNSVLAKNLHIKKHKKISWNTIVRSLLGFVP